MHHPLARAVRSVGLVLFLSVLPSVAGNVVVEDRVIAGGPADSLEVRHLVLRGTNEQIGRALADIAKQRYGVRLEPSTDPLRARAQRRYLERNDPILLDRMRGVAAAFDKPIEDDAWDFTTLGFTDLKAACSVAHLPPSSTSNGKSVVTRDYDFSTGSLSFGFLPPGMLHPTARPYLVELHPDRGYASIAMVAYDLLSGVLDGMNSEGLTVTLAMDDEQFVKGAVEPTRAPAVGLAELQTLRLLLDTCATVEEAKETLLSTKQYYQYVPVHYLIADRNGNAFVWEYSELHNKEYILESPGEPLVMTNFTLHKRLENGKPPSAEKAGSVCKRYEFLREKLGAGGFDDREIREIHQQVDGQLSPAANPSRPPIRTFWHAFFYPEERRVRLSYYLRDEAIPGETRRVRPVRTDYLEFRLEPTGDRGGSAKVEKPAPRAPNATPVSTNEDTQSALEAGGASVKRDGKRIVSVHLEKASQLETLLPLLAALPDLEELNLGNAAMTDARMRELPKLPKLQRLGLMDAPIGDAALEVVKTLPGLRVLNIGGTKVTDAGLAHLADLAALEYLGLMRTGVTDAGLAHLAGLQRLESLNLSNAGVTDAGLVHLGRLSGLAGLNLTGTKVTDAGLVQLKTLPRLTKLNLTGTAVTEQGVNEAKKVLPFWTMVTR